MRIPDAFLHRFVCLLLFCFSILNLHAQEGEVVELFQPRTETRAALDTQIHSYSLLQPDKVVLAFLEKTRPEQVSFHLWVKNKRLSVRLKKVNLFSAMASFSNSSNTITYQPQLHYQGEVDGVDGSLAAITIGKDQVSGVISDEEGNINLSPLPNDPDESLHIVYRAKDVRIKPDWECHAPDLNQLPQLQKTAEDPLGDAVTVGCPIDVYFEADYSLFQQWKNVSAAIDYIAAFFNVAKRIYENENISIQISGIKVWDIHDPYESAQNTSTALTAFGSRMAAGFNGDLAHLLTHRSLGGGRAWIDVLCNSSSYYKTGVSSIGVAYANFPNYSWTTYVVAHELGHNLGSPHTQSCTWPGGPIDNCAEPENGSCAKGPAPVNGGTLMSYCHQTSYGINFRNGFGPLPGNLIRSRAAAADCLCDCEKLDITVAATDAACGVKGSAFVQVSGGVPPYRYKWSTGDTSSSVKNLAPGAYFVEISNLDGTCKTVKPFSIKSVGLIAATITPSGTVVECGSSRLLSAVQVGNGYRYEWYKNNVLIKGATQSAYIAASSGAYKVKISAGGCSVVSAATTVQIAGVARPAITTNRPALLCEGENVRLSIASRAGYAYQWYRNKDELLRGAVNASFTAIKSGTYSVRVSFGGCTAVSSNTIKVIVSKRPEPVISALGSTTFCEGDSIILKTTGGNYTYQWLNGTNALAGASKTQLIVRSSGLYAIQVNNNGCMAQSAAIPVLVKPAPSAALNASGTVALCAGDSLKLVSATAAGYRHQWLLDGSELQDATGESLVIKASGSYKMQNTLEGCTKVSEEVVVSILPKPKVTVLPKQITHAKGRPLTLTASGAAQYNFTDLPYYTSSTSTSVTLNPPQSINYVIAGRGANGCTAYDTSFVTVVGCGDATDRSAEVLSPARVLVRWTNPPGVLADTLEYRVRNKGAWTKIYVQGNNYMLVGLKPGTEYEFRVKTLCSSSQQHVYSETGLFTTKSLKIPVYVNVFPNPVSPDSYLELILPYATSIEAVLYSKYGQVTSVLIPRTKLNNGHFYQKLNLPTSLAQGVYLLVVRVNDIPFVFKLVKTR